jgi:hypothetical protein
MKCALFYPLLFIVLTSRSQLPVPTNLTHAYKAGTRVDGRSTKAYWQNRADYDITADFDCIRFQQDSVPDSSNR